MRKQFLFLFILSCLSSKAQLVTDSFLIDNNYRTFHFRKPSSTNIKSSLIFILHGSGGSGEGIMKGTGKLEAIAEKENIVLVYPDGYKHFWNECRKAATSAANIENIDETLAILSILK